MTGCRYPSNPHIQSMLYAMDRKGLPIVVNGGAIYDCKKRHDHAGLDFESFRWKIIWRYEIKVSELILKAGYIWDIFCCATHNPVSAQYHAVSE